MPWTELSPTSTAPIPWRSSSQQQYLTHRCSPQPAMPRTPTIQQLATAQKDISLSSTAAQLTGALPNNELSQLLAPEPSYLPCHTAKEVFFGKVFFQPSTSPSSQRSIAITDKQYA